ncbi:MAG: hypothetical protein LUH00_02500 [Lachnospiraceae bacterium]|nr:hypothetical protein [Lachnospiraceae bacterium]
MIRKKMEEAYMGYINNRRNSCKKQQEKHLLTNREPFLCAEEIEGRDPKGEKAGGFPSVIPLDFSHPADELQAERDFRMLQSMYPNLAKELLPFIEEECDRMEYEGSAMFDEYPDFTTVYALQKKIAEAARKQMASDRADEQASRPAASVEDVTADPAENKNAAAQAEEICVPLEDLIRVMVLQEMHRRRGRYRFCRDKC